jgi:hypothetical protein
MALPVRLQGVPCQKITCCTFTVPSLLQQLHSCAPLLQAILRDSVVSVEIEVKPHNLVPDTNCFIDYLSQLQIIAEAGPAQKHYYTLMVPLVGEWHVTAQQIA